MSLSIAISWTKPVPQGATIGYNVYQVNGAPATTTRTLLAFVNGYNVTTYTFTGTENATEFTATQYQFEVRATDGTNEGPPLEVFYPQGTSLWTPTTITPTGLPMMLPRDVAYLTKDEFINYPNGLGLTTSSTLYTSGVLDVYLQAASEEVNQFCHRHFNVQTIDEVYHGIRIGQDEPKLQTVPLNEGPIQNVNSIYIQVLKFFINFSLEYLQVFPDQGFIQIVPFLGGNASGIPLPSAVLTEGLLGKVWVNYTFGYDVIPNSVKLATSLLATKLIGMEENPVSAQSVKFGRNFSLQWDKDNDPLYRQVEMLLKPYRRSVYRRP